ncbi:hypothetical protein HX014_16590 [Myroides marinus]|uniref:toxin-antitoxin system YwqK family antitoxin n=1 Tax=Myroides marinus TaxID=703342 RepID=UPI0025783F42|nr:hypothetical protein [Myroides marinus]MDM1352208.1 hypothetical protein [Myroides marinus]MDM1359406.1 hypothetical protein [Myroides marinus]
MNKVINYLSSFIIYYCKVVNFDILENRDNFVYLKNNNSAFTGTAISYYHEGGIKEKLSFKNGLKHGKAITYYKSGKIREKVLFKNGFLNKTAYMYKENGELAAKIRYKNGEIV